MHQSLFSLSLHLKTGWIQIRPEWNSGKNALSIKKIGHVIESMQNVGMSTFVVQEKMGFQLIYCVLNCIINKIDIVFSRFYF